MSVAAFLDASVLYPATLRSVLMYLAAADVFRALWSDAISAEWMAALARNRPDLSTVAIAKVRALMEAHVEHAIVSGYESLIPSLTLPDPSDRHVLAAAIHGGANVIVTSNIKHSPPGTLAHNITAQPPDAFVRSLLDGDRDSAIEAFAADRARLRSPAMTLTEYIASLARAGLAETAATLRANEDRL